MKNFKWIYHRGVGFSGIPLTLHGGRPSSRSSQRSESGGPLSCAAFSRRPSSGGSRGPLVPASRAGAARAAAILLISCHLQAATKGGNKHRRTLSDVAEGSSDGLGRRPISISMTLTLTDYCYIYHYLSNTPWKKNVSEFFSKISSEFFRILATFSERRQSNSKKFRKKKTNKRIQNDLERTLIFLSISLNFQFIRSEYYSKFSKFSELTESFFWFFFWICPRFGRIFKWFQNNLEKTIIFLLTNLNFQSIWSENYSKFS